MTPIPLSGDFFFVYFAHRDMSTTKQSVRVLRPYKTFEGQTRYMVIREDREVPVSMKVVLTR